MSFSSARRTTIPLSQTGARLSGMHLLLVVAGRTEVLDNILNIPFSFICCEDLSSQHSFYRWHNFLYLTQHIWLWAPLC